MVKYLDDLFINIRFNVIVLYNGVVNYKFTSEVPVEHETLKSGRDVTGRDGTTDDGRWKDRREG